MKMVFWLKLLSESSKLLLTGIILILLVSPVLNWQKIYQTKEFFDSIQYSNNSLYTIAIYLAAIQFLDFVLNRLKGHLQERFSLKVTHKLDHYLQELLKPIHTITLLESPKYSNDLNILKNNITNVGDLVNSIITMLHQLILITLYIYLIIKYSWIIVLIVLLFSIPNLLHGIYQTNSRTSFFKKNSQIQLETNNLHGMLTHPYVQKELLVFSSRSFLMDKWSIASIKSLINRIKILWIEFKLGVLLDFINPAGYLVIQFLLIYELINERINIGDYIAITLSASMLESALRTFCFSINSTKYFKIFVNNLKEFNDSLGLSKHNNLVLRELDEILVIETRNLSFTYPLQNREVINDISIRIDLGDFVAIVGENGSGKSTLAKVLVGMHEVSENMLFVNDIEINKISRDALLKKISIVSQDFIKYPLSVGENISMKHVDTKTIELLYELFRKYPKLIPDLLISDMESILGSEYLHSNQLSGGQWQRIAIARALYKECDYLLLDEATSELDPIAEIELINNILVHRRRKTTILVTHNLNLASKADQVYVLKDGKIKEYGTHKKLINQGEEYYNMWISQEGDKHYEQN